MPRIVVLHDDDDIRDVLCVLLSLTGYTVVTGTVTATHLISSPYPDLVILDMSEVAAARGWAALDQLTTDPTTGTIPLLVCSTSPHILADVQQRGLPTFSEPFHPDVVLALVAAQL